MRRNQCQNNLKQLSLACLNHESSLGSLPSGFTSTPAPGFDVLHTWASYVLPYLEEAAVFDQIDFSKPSWAPWVEAGRPSERALDLHAIRRATLPLRSYEKHSYRCCGEFRSRKLSGQPGFTGVTASELLEGDRVEIGKKGSWTHVDGLEKSLLN